MNRTIELIKELIGAEDLVSFREFVTSKEFCGRTEVYEFWLSRLDALPTTISELLIDGSLGGGKTYCMNYYMAYRLYRLFAGGSPQTQLDLAEDSDIWGFYFTVSLDLAKHSGFSHLQSIFKNCKWFKEHAPVNTQLKSIIEFPQQHFIIKAGSDFGHQLGLNVYMYALDEANFREGIGKGMAKEYEEVTMLYKTLIDRQASRMSNADGTVNALAILISSASYQTSFMETRKEAIKDNPNAANITAVTYEIRPEKFSKEKFEVFIGCGSIEPTIVIDEEHKQKLLQKSNMLGTGQEETFFRKVPVSLKKLFQEDIITSIQNHCGVPTLIKGSFMANMKSLFDSYVSEEELPLCFQSEELTASTEDNTELIEYFIPSAIQYPERPVSIFLDLSVQSDMGSMVAFRFDGNVRGRNLHAKLFELKIKPPMFPASTDITKVGNLVIDLAQYLNIVAFGTDQFQSTSTRQRVQKELDLTDIRVSIDSSDIPHSMWIRALAEGRIKQRRSELLEREAKEAVHDYEKHRILKAKGSTDDTLQGNVGAFFLSETVGSQFGVIDDLYKDRTNLVGARALERFLTASGYKRN